MVAIAQTAQIWVVIEEWYVLLLFAILIFQKYSFLQNYKTFSPVFANISKNTRLKKEYELFNLWILLFNIDLLNFDLSKACH